MDKPASTTMTLQEAFDLAVNHHQAGRFSEAEAIYRRILAVSPDNPDALHLLGVLATQLGSADAALDLIRRAIAINPRSAQYHVNLGAALAKLGRTNQAIESYQRALLLQPDLLDAHQNLGIAYVRLGEFSKAADAYRKALTFDANNVKVLDSLGSALSQGERQDEAIAVLQKALALQPDYAPAHLTLGNAYSRMKRTDEAIAAYRAALALRPDYPEVLSNLANMLKDKGEYDQAIERAQQALKLHPTMAEAWYHLGNALKKKDRLEEAIDALRRAVAINPRFHQAYNDLGSALLKKDLADEAIIALHKSLEIEPNGQEAHYNLGAALQRQDKFDEALACYAKAQSLGLSHPNLHNNIGTIMNDRGLIDQAIWHFRKSLEIQPDFAVAKWNLGLLALAKGDFREGWPGYEMRWEANSIAKPPRYNEQPVWDGSDPAGKRILLDCEQGFGDAIQFARFVPILARHGAKPMIACPPVLNRLFKTLSGVEDVISPPTEIGPFDAQIPLMSIPSVMNMTLQTIPGKVPYLAADPALAEQWKTRVPQDGRLKVGLVWAGNPKFSKERMRSLMLAPFAPLGDVPNVWYCSLQKGEAARQAASPPGSLRIVDWTEELTNFADTAALIVNLDLVIACDTAVAHLAGALAKPVWIIVPFVPDWRWLLDRSDSPWYPTLRIFRQPKPGDWETPINQLVDQLRKLRESGPN
jgi:tetratricopeptide (TPR) repeat protein